MLLGREGAALQEVGSSEQRPPKREGGRPRSVNILDRFDIDYALCMYCGICVEVCPFDALFWSPEYEYSEPRIADLLHDKAKLRSLLILPWCWWSADWAATIAISPSASNACDETARAALKMDASLRRIGHKLPNAL